MCNRRKIIWGMVALSVLEMGLGASSIVLGVVGIVLIPAANKLQFGDASPIWSGVCFLVCGSCGVLCANRRSGLIMILFSACCICGLISGILNIQFVRAAARHPDAPPSLRLACVVLACLGIVGCTAFTWLTCRLASSEQQRMYLERELSLHRSHEMSEKGHAERLSLAHISFSGKSSHPDREPRNTQYQPHP